MRHIATIVGLGILNGFLAGAPAQAQTPPPAAEPKVWTENASAGLAMTEGNTDTSTINIGYEVMYDPHARNLVKSSGLFLRSDSDDELTADRLELIGRDEYKIRDGIFIFGQMQYLRDRFKDITYLIAPTGGLGYRAINTPRTMLSVDVGAGGVWEKNSGSEAHDSGAFMFGDKLQHKISPSATFTEVFNALYKIADFSDVLYVFDAALAATVSTKTQIKVEVVDTFKNKPPTALVQKNDVAFIVALVYKN